MLLRSSRFKTRRLAEAQVLCSRCPGVNGEALIESLLGIASRLRSLTQRQVGFEVGEFLIGRLPWASFSGDELDGSGLRLIAR
jgi:hypothetical protein